MLKVYTKDKKNINASNVKITSLSVNPKIFKLRLIAIGFKIPKTSINPSIINEILPKTFKFSFFRKPIDIKDKNVIVKSTVIPVKKICIRFWKFIAVLSADNGNNPKPTADVIVIISKNIKPVFVIILQSFLNEVITIAIAKIIEKIP